MWCPWVVSGGNSGTLTPLTLQIHCGIHKRISGEGRQAHSTTEYLCMAPRKRRQLIWAHADKEKVRVGSHVNWGHHHSLGHWCQSWYARQCLRQLQLDLKQYMSSVMDSCIWHVCIRHIWQLIKVQHQVPPALHLGWEGLLLSHHLPLLLQWGTFPAGSSLTGRGSVPQRSPILIWGG